MGSSFRPPRLATARVEVMGLCNAPESRAQFVSLCAICAMGAQPLVSSANTNTMTLSLLQHLFPLLPPELRLKIWNLNLPSSRLVSIRCGSESPSLYEDPSTSPSRPAAPVAACTTACTSSAPIPANLHACAESRAEASKNYMRAFGFARGPGQVVFNPDSDILFFGPRDGYMAADSQFHTCMSMCDQAELARVRRVAVSDSLFWVNGTYQSMTAASLTVRVVRELARRMPSLDVIFFVPRQEDEHDDGTGRLAMTRERMACQMQMALDMVCEQLPHWRPPYYEILCLSALSTMGG